MKLFTIAEAAKELRVHEATVRRLLRSRKLPHLKIGKLYFITEQDLSAFYALSSVPAVTQAKEGDKTSEHA